MTATHTSVEQFSDPDALGRALADEIADGIAAAVESGLRYVLGCPGGRSPRPVYRALTAEAAHRRLDISHLVIAMMDDYAIDTGGEFRNVADTESYSVARFGVDEIVEPLASLGLGRPELWAVDAADPGAHEERIAAAGIDLFILASGSGDGHVAFNGPGTERDARSRVVTLPDSTRRDNLRTYPEFGSIDGAPRYGVTIGTGTIAEYSKRAVLIAHGAEKRTAAAHLISSGEYDPGWPATIVHECRSAAIYLDDAAARSGG